MQQSTNAPSHSDALSAEDAKKAAHVVGVQASKDHSFSKPSIGSIRLIEGFGVEGDAHGGATDQHLFHIKRFGDHPNLRQVHLIQSEFFDAVGKHGHLVRPGDLGENITTRGVDLLGLPTGSQLMIGRAAVIELTGLRNPCHQIDKFQAGLLQHCKEATPEGVLRKAGVMAIVVRGGVIEPGDPITVTLPPTPHRSLVYRTPLTG